MGGMFGLQGEIRGNPAKAHRMNPDGLLLVNARSAIWFITRHLAPRIVWLPSFLCGAICEAVSKAGAEVRFYPMDYDLRMASDLWIDEVDQEDIVVFIDYFGFPCDPLPVQTAKSRGAIVVRDACQALLTPAASDYDFTVFSPRKFFGLPDGGILVDHYARIPRPDIVPAAPTEWVEAALTASRLRRDFDEKGGENLWYGVFREVERDAPVGFHAMSSLSQSLLNDDLERQASSERRRRNYAILLEQLRSLALYPELPASAVPLGFPIRHPEREALRDRLIANRIYPPVHWHLADVVPQGFAASHELSSRILTLPCDQRYGATDMQRLIRCVATV